MRTSLFSLLLVLTASTVQAQVRDSQGTFSGIVGGGQIWDDEGSLGRGLLAGAAIDRTLFGTTRAELSLEVLTHDRNAGYFQANGQTVIGGVSIVHRFGRGAAQPYLFGGLTAGRHSGWVQFEDRRSDVANTDMGMRFGFGLAFRAGARYEITPEVRVNGFFIDNDSDPATMASFGIRFGMRL